MASILLGSISIPSDCNPCAIVVIDSGNRMFWAGELVSVMSLRNSARGMPERGGRDVWSTPARPFSISIEGSVALASG